MECRLTQSMAEKQLELSLLSASGGPRVSGFAAPQGVRAAFAHRAGRAPAMPATGSAVAAP